MKQSKLIAMVESLKPGVVLKPSQDASAEILALTVQHMPSGTILYLASDMPQFKLEVMLNSKPEWGMVKLEDGLTETNLRLIENHLKRETVVDLGCAGNRNGFFNNQVCMSANPLGKRVFSESSRSEASSDGATNLSVQRPRIN